MNKKFLCLFLSLVFFLNIIFPSSISAAILKKQTVKEPNFRSRAIEVYNNATHRIANSNEDIFISEEIIIKLNAPVLDNDLLNPTLLDLNNMYGIKIINSLDTYTKLASFDIRKTSMDILIKALNSRSDIEYAEPNYLKKKKIEVNSNPLFSQQWGMEDGGLADINVDTAWTVTKGDKRVIVGVIDTGVDISHPDLADNIWVNNKEIADNGKDDDNNGYTDDINGWDFFDDTNKIVDVDGHGTHVAGIIAAQNNNIGIEGVAPGVLIMPLKVGNGEFDTYSVVSAIQYGKKKGVSVFNCSYVSPDTSNIEYEAMKNTNAIFACASGNDALNNDRHPQYPASYDLANVISVAASNEYGRLTSFSDYGVTSVNIAAPGTNILSTIPDNDYEEKDGTSMATPFVAGVAALVKSTNLSLKPSEVRKYILDNGKKKSNLSTTISSGSILDAGAAVKAANNAAKINLTSIKFEKTNLNLYKGDKTILKVTFSPDNASNQLLTWSSSNQAVVNVDENGEITAVGIGTSEIKAVSDDGKYMAVCQVTVPDPIPNVYSEGNTFRLKILINQVFQGDVKFYMIEPNGDLTDYDGDFDSTGYYVDLEVDQNGIVDNDELDPITDAGVWEVDSVVVTLKNGASVNYLNEKYYNIEDNQNTSIYMDQYKFGVRGVKGELPDNTKKIANKSLVDISNEAPSISSADVSSSLIKIGNIIRLNFHVKDKYGIWAGKVNFQKPDGKIGTFDLNTDSRNGLYYVYLRVSDVVSLRDFEINPKTENGVWKIKSLELSNVVNKKITYNNSYFGGNMPSFDLSSCDFNVVNESVKAEKLTLETKSADIKKGAYFRLFYTVTPENVTNGELIWLSSDDKIATVNSSGVIKGISKGAAKITGITRDGTYISVTFTVKVDNPVLIKSITILKTLSMKKGTSKKLTVKISPTNADNKSLVWSSSKKSIATVDSKGTVKALKPGKVTIKAMSKDGSGKYAICTITIK